MLGSFQSQILEALGATVERVRPVSIAHRDHYVNVARRRALEATKLAAMQREASKMEGNSLIHINGHTPPQEECHPISSADCKGGFFADQFENLANFRAHYEWTGPEIWEQTQGNLHAFVAAAGTGGTVAGISRFLKVCLRHLSFVYCILIFCSNKVGFAVLNPCVSFPGKESKY